MRLVPRQAILAVTDREMPHVSNRVECWNFSTGYQGSDYVLYTTDHPIQSERDQFDAHPNLLRKRVVGGAQAVGNQFVTLHNAAAAYEDFGLPIGSRFFPFCQKDPGTRVVVDGRCRDGRADALLA